MRSQDQTSLPDWIKKRYFSLLERFKDDNFNFEEAKNTLFSLYKDSEEQTKLILSELKRANYLEVTKNPDDKREAVYKLIDIFKQITELSKDKLITVLKNAADIIRTRVDYTFILLLLFYKAVSDRWQKEFQKRKEELTKKGLKGEELIREATQPYYYREFHLKPELLWDELRKEPLKLPENLSKNLKELAELNPDYKEIFAQFDFHQFISNPESQSILNKLFELFSQYSFENISSDILGDTYEWILKYFAPTKAKEGEVYTPREVIRLMVEFLSPQPTKSVYDPAVGSAGMLIVAYQYVKEKYGEEKANTLFLYGQEQNPKTLALAKMNAILHGIKNINLVQGDTLLYPKFKSGDSIKKFDYVIANPPWNQDGYDEDTLKKGEYWQERFIFGFPTRQSADWVWIQHMLASVKDESKVVVVIDTGAVSRGGREQAIRQKVVEADLIEAIILLPEKLFYNTGAPGIIIVFDKNKPPERKGKILLINATKEFVPGKPQNILGKKNIRKIVDIYRQFKEVDKFSQVVTTSQIREADYNLSPSRFVWVWEEEEYREIGEIKKELSRLEKIRRQVESKIEKIFQGLT